MAEAGFALEERFNVEAMQQFMRSPDIYWAASDALAPQPEQMDFTGHLLHPDVWTLAATYRGHIVGYVQFVRRTSVGAEIHTGFHPSCRGKVAKTFVEYAIARAWAEKGLLKLWGIIASDNRRAVMGAAACGFVREGCIRNAIVREGADEGKPPLRDLLIFGLSRPTRSN